MGKAANKRVNSEISANKRERGSSEEISPSVAQERKSVRMASQDMLELINSVAQISSKMTKLDLLDSMNDEIKNIAKSNEEMRVAIHGVVSRVDEFEREINGMKKSSEETVRELKKKINYLEQAQVSNTVLVKNLPANLHNDSMAKGEALKKIFGALGVDQSIYYHSDSSLSSDRQTTTIRLRFVSPLVKNDIVRNYRNVKKNETGNINLLVEKITTLPNDSPLNGLHVKIVNKLSQHYTQIISHARTFVGTHFDFVHDSPEGDILVRCLGRFTKVHNEEDVKRLVDEVVSKGEVKTKPVRLRNQTQSQVRTRLQSQKDQA